MASGIEHERAYNRTISLLQPVCFLSVVILVYQGHFGLVSIPTGLITGLYIGRRVEPDLDLAQITLSERRIIQKSPILGRLWRCFWKPYSRRYAHRSRESHMPILGTWLRWRRLLLLPFVLGLFGLWALSLNDLESIAIYVMFWLGQFSGQTLQDIVHWWLDGRPLFS